MEMTGEQVIPARRDKVWHMLNDPVVLRDCIPGCTELEGSPDQGFTATVNQTIGPVKATFKAEVTLSNLNPPESYTIVGSGKGGVAGFAKGAADIRLDEVEDGTRLKYEVKAQVGGKLAQLGSRLVDSTAKKLAAQFFSNFENHVRGETLSGGSVEPGEEGEAKPEPQTPDSVRAGTRTVQSRNLLYLAAGIVLIAALLFAIATS